MNPTKLVVSPNRALFAKRDEHWHMFYVSGGKMYRHAKHLSNTFNGIKDASVVTLAKGNLIDWDDWIECTDLNQLHPLAFFDAPTGSLQNTFFLMAELTNISAAKPGNEVAAGDVGPDADLTDASLADRYPKYYKRIPPRWKVIDVYGVHSLFPVQDFSGCLHHSSKKLLVPGVRTGGKSMRKDILEARDTLNRWLELNPEVADEPINQ